MPNCRSTTQMKKLRILILNSMSKEKMSAKILSWLKTSVQWRPFKKCPFAYLSCIFKFLGINVRLQLKKGKKVCRNLWGISPKRWWPSTWILFIHREHLNPRAPDLTTTTCCSATFPPRCEMYTNRPWTILTERILWRVTTPNSRKHLSYTTHLFGDFWMRSTPTEMTSTF